MTTYANITPTPRVDGIVYASLTAAARETRLNELFAQRVQVRANALRRLQTIGFQP